MTCVIFPTALGVAMPLICGDDQPCQPPKWRIPRTLALFDFVFVEGLTVAGDKRAHYRMFWLVGLQVPEAPPRLAPCPSNHLVQQLKSTLRRTRIAVTKAEIRVDDTDQVELGKMVPFGDKLRTDDEIEASLGDVVELLPKAFDRFHKIARQHKNTSLWK